MNKKQVEKTLGITTFICLLLPFFAFESHHDCMYDECYKIFYNDRFGMCIEATIDEICKTICVAWFFVFIWSALVFSNDKNAISPFVVIGILIAFSFLMAFIDPAKWCFALSLLPSVVLFAIAIVVDKNGEP